LASSSHLTLIHSPSASAPFGISMYIPQRLTAGKNAPHYSTRTC
jgi:hypothetical protein